jgi:hypothetical protein
MARIFISYRRSDSAGHAQLLNEYLEVYRPGEVFFDNNTLEDGDRWDRQIAQHLEDCEALLVVIGPGWLRAQDPESGQRRLDNPEDWVRREIEAALARGARVIPVLMGGATLPKPEHLPPSIRDLARCEARTIGERDTRDDVRRLAEHLRSAVTANCVPYLQALRRETAYMDIRGLQVGSPNAHRFPIDELYTPLTTVLRSDDHKGAEERRAVPLEEALRAQRVVIVGDPGAGKSTFLRRIAFAACETLSGTKPAAARELLALEPCPMPFLVAASSLVNFIETSRNDRRRAWPPDPDSPEWLVRYLEWKSGESGWGLAAKFFSDWLWDGCLLLVDGLDEAPDRTRRDQLVSLLAKAGTVYGKTRIVAATRPSAFGGITDIRGYERVDVGPLDDAAISTFTAKWCHSLYPDDPGGAAANERALLEAIRSKPEIRGMAANPVMLTALAVLHWNQRRLPDQRTELYDSVLTWLARAKEGLPGRPQAEQSLDLLKHLAFVMHSDPIGKQVEIGGYAAARAVAPRFRGVPEEDALKAADEFLRDQEMNSGILVARNERLKFWHLTFQEYLAATVLVWRDEERRRLLFEEGKLYAPEWRETVLLLAGVLCKQAPERVDEFLGAVFDRLGPEATLAERARCAGLVGRILEDLKGWKYRLTDPRWRENLARMPEIFEVEAARAIDFQARLEAAEALGQAGDPRLERENWVRVEGGAFWMGAQRTDPSGQNYDLNALQYEGPAREVEVQPFWMGRYPVTVVEYERFINDGGCSERRFWAAGGYGRFSEPGSWGAQRRYPNRPVVNVSWYEAAAYCAWTKGRLPPEEEWECAARCGREGVRYPWGNEKPDSSRANHDRGPIMKDRWAVLRPWAYTWTEQRQMESTTLRGTCGSGLRRRGRDRRGPLFEVVPGTSAASCCGFRSVTSMRRIFVSAI